MSTVIKAGEAVKLVSRLTTVDLADHLAEARAVVDAARRQANGMVQQAESRVDQIVDDAKRQGQDDGYKRGYAEGLAIGRDDAFREATEKFDKQHEGLVRALTTLLDVVDDEKRDLAIAAEQEVLSFAIQLATKLTFEIGACHTESATANLARAIQLVGTRNDITVRVNPADHATMETFAPQLGERLGTSLRVKCIVDESIDPGGCQVRTEASEVDATLRTQIDEIVALLLGHDLNVEADVDAAS